MPAARPGKKAVSVCAHAPHPPTSPGPVRSVSKISIHPNFISFAFDNDFAVLTLGTPVPLPPVALNAASGLEAVGTFLMVAGWGDVQDGGPGSDVLLVRGAPMAQASPSARRVRCSP